MIVKLLVAVLVGVALPAQEPGSGPGKPGPGKPAQRPGVNYDANGWPIVPDEPARRSVIPGETPRRSPPRELAPAQEPKPAPLVEVGSRREVAQPLASGMDLGSPLLDVFQYTRSPGAFRQLGGRQVWWRVTIFGAQGEVLGIREVTHLADCGSAERDRLEYDNDGRVYGRLGGSVFAERQGMPWPSDAERGGDELALFGTHLRTPWCFGDGITYSVMSVGSVDRPGERLRRVSLERRPPQGSELIGPELDPRPRDRFELIFEPGTGKPREFVHRFAASGLTRRVLFEDWRDENGIRMPFRRIYVDEALRRTTMLEILNLAPQQVNDRTFRLH